MSPLIERGPLGCAAFLTLITLRVLLPSGGDVRTVCSVENGRYVGPAKSQNVAAGDNALAKRYSRDGRDGNNRFVVTGKCFQPSSVMVASLAIPTDDRCSDTGFRKLAPAKPWPSANGRERHLPELIGRCAAHDAAITSGPRPPSGR
jgi:hypothetical protein